MSSSDDDSSNFSDNNYQEFRKEEKEEEEEDDYQPALGLGNNIPKRSVPYNPLGTGFIPKQDATVDKDFAKFDKGGKLMRMMEKMGYKKGMGIGKDGKGIAVPVEVVMRQAGVGIGFDKSDKIKKPQQQKPQPPVREQGWKATASKTRKKLPPTAYEIIHEELDHHKPKDKVHAIRDMTGSEEKVLTDFSNLSSSQQVKDTRRLPELRYNINLITNLAKTDLSYLAKQLSLEEDSQRKRKDDIEKTLELIHHDKEELGLVEDYLSICQSIKVLITDHKDDIANLELSPQDCYSIFKSSIESLPSTHHLNSLKYHLFQEIIQPRVQSWSPLHQPNYFLPLLLISQKSLGDLHDWLVYKLIVPSIRLAIIEYDTYQPDNLISFMEQSKPIFTDWVWSHLTSLIIPRLEKVIEEFDFKKDWRIQNVLVPFVSILSMDRLWRRVRERMTVFISAAGLRLAMEIYDYWSQLWDDDESSKFMEKGVLPKLVEFVRREVVIDPGNQDLGPLEAVLKWRGKLKDHLLSNLLVTEFFSKWNEILRIWISTPHVDLDEISQWYTAWKVFFENQGVIHLIGVKEAFKNGLDLINQGLSGNLRGVSQVKVKSRVPKVVKTLKTAQLSFKELVELECAERSIEFLPLQKRNAEGKEVYKMGKVKVYIDDGVLFVNVGGEYKYMSIEDAMNMASE